MRNCALLVQVYAGMARADLVSPGSKHFMFDGMAVKERGIAQTFIHLPVVMALASIPTISYTSRGSRLVVAAWGTRIQRPDTDRHRRGKMEPLKRL